MELLKKIMANMVFAVLVLLAFLLIYEQQLELPAWLQAFGRMHPLLLHLPIGLLLLTAILVFLRKHFESESFDALISFLLHLSVLTAAVTALMGLFLSREGGYAEQDLLLHKWLGFATCLIGALLIITQQKKTLFKAILVVSLIALIFTGHYGANLTHGENFVMGPLQTEQPKLRIVTDSSTMFEAVVDPVLEAKCYSCHNETKAKGRLVLTSLPKVLEGGKNGKLWEGNDVSGSLLMKRLLLPHEDKEHMPPKDKAQLTSDELKFLSMWISGGADVKRTLKEYPDGDSLKKLSLHIINQQQQQHSVPTTQYHFAFASREKVDKLSNPYRAVFQLARTEPALQADFFVRQAFEKKSLEELSDVKEQMVSISLAKMPITDDDLKMLTPFKNLEELNLNNTDITGKGLSALQSLQKLKSLSLAGTKVTVESLETLVPLKTLKKVFIWNTGIDAQGVEVLRKKYPAIDWELGYVPDAKEILQLSPPLMANESQVLKEDESITLKASLPGTVIRYTTNGAKPDSLTGSLYDAPISIGAYLTLKARAFKEGWKSSEAIDLVFFKKGFKPTRATLKTAPDDQYPGDGVATFTDDKKGSPDFFKDPTWIAFRDRPLEAVFYFDEAPSIRSLTVSYSRNVGAMTMPPAEIEVWGGSDEQHLTLLQKVKPVQPTEYGSSRIEGVEVVFPKVNHACYKLVAKPLMKLPEFRKAGPKDKGWLMVDEVFFN